MHFLGSFHVILALFLLISVFHLSPNSHAHIQLMAISKPYMLQACQKQLYAEY